MTMKPAIVIGLCLVLASAIIALVPRLAPTSPPGNTDQAELVTSELAQVKNELGRVKGELARIESAIPPAPSKPVVEEAPTTAVRLSSADLFPSELTRLQPHVPHLVASEGILASTVVRMKYGGPLDHLRVVCQVWRQGKADVVFNQSMSGIRLEEGAELSISVREVNRDNKPEYRVILAWPNHSSRFLRFSQNVDVAKPEFRAAGSRLFWMPKEDNRPEYNRPLYVKVPGEVAAWTWEQTTDSGFGWSESPAKESDLKKAEWALAIKLLFSDKPPIDN